MWYVVFCKGFLLDHCLDVQLNSVNVLLAHFTYVPRLKLAHVFQNQQTLICDTREFLEMDVYLIRVFQSEIKDTDYYKRFTIYLHSYFDLWSISTETRCLLEMPANSNDRIALERKFALSRISGDI